MLAADIVEGPHDADIFLNLKETDLVSGVKQATGGKGVDIVLDTIGAKLFGPSLRSLRVGGRQIAIANNSPNPEVQLNLADFYHNELHLIGADTQKLTGPEIAAVMNHLREGFQGGHLHVAQPEADPFDQAVEAYTKVAEKKARTKQALVFR